jgi:hypothetical protein
LLEALNDLYRRRPRRPDTAVERSRSAEESRR